MKIYTVNIKSDLPTAEQALRRINSALSTGRNLGAPAVKLIHGYGSGGQGGKIRTEARRMLAELQRSGKIRMVLPGETFDIFDGNTQQALALCPALRQDCDLNRSNSGITLVLLR